MFCPLCKAEYRDGFAECSDCHLLLVATQEEAERRTVASVWKGGDKSQLESVLTALHDAKIANVFRERLNVYNAAKMTFLGMAWHVSQSSDTQFEIKIPGDDLDRAREAIRQALGEESCRGVRYCTVCKAPYLEGFTRCSDCGVPLVKELAADSASSPESSENELPYLARTPIFLGWFVPFGMCLLSVLLAFFRPVIRGNPIFVLFLFLEILCASCGILWMIFQTLRYERRQLIKYILLSLVPFMFVWYWLVRVPPTRERGSKFSAFS